MDPGRWRDRSPCRRPLQPCSRAPQPSTGSPSPSPRGPPRNRTGTPTLWTTRATAATRAAPAGTAGTGNFEDRRTEIVGHHRGPARSSRDHEPSMRCATPPTRRVLRARPLWPLLNTRPSNSRASAVTGSERSIRVMCLIPVNPSTPARWTEATNRSSSSNAEPANPVRLRER